MRIAYKRNNFAKEIHPQVALHTQNKKDVLYYLVHA